MKSGIKREAEYAISTIQRYLWLDKLIKRQMEEIWLEPWYKGTIPDCIDHILKHDVRAHGFSWVRTGFNVLSIDLGLAEICDMGAKILFKKLICEQFFFRTQDVDVEMYICYKSCPNGRKYMKRILHFKNNTFKFSYNWFKIDIHQQLRPLTANYLAMFKVISTTIYT